MNIEFSWLKLREGHVWVMYKKEQNWKAYKKMYQIHIKDPYIVKWHLNRRQEKTVFFFPSINYFLSIFWSWLK